MLVQRLDRPDSYYYVVPATEAENVPLAVLVNARTGEYLQSAVQRSDRGSIFKSPIPKPFANVWSEKDSSCPSKPAG